MKNSLKQKMFARAFPTVVLTLFFLIGFGHGFSQTANGDVARKNEDSLLSILEDKFQTKLGEYLSSFTNYLEDYNDKHLGASELGRLLHYDEIKPKLEMETARGRMKKMAMAMMPLVFHVGATSTWMMLTSIMTVKSVLIGLALLIFKIAVSSAKLAAFFTQWKGHHHHEDHHGWTYSSPPHHEYHGHDRSFSDIDHPIEHTPDLPDHHTSDHSSHSSDWHSYSPEWTPNDIPTDYHTIPSSYKHADKDEIPDYKGPYLPIHAEDRNKIVDKKKFT